MRWITAAAVLGVVLLAVTVACSNTDELESRLSSVEARIDSIERTGAQVPVVTYALEGCAADPSGFALHWVIAGIPGEHCFSGDSDCAQDARVGEVLPESCGGPRASN